MPAATTKKTPARPKATSAKSAPAKPAPTGARARPASATGSSDLHPVFAELRAILKPLAKGLVVVHDSDDHFYVDTTRNGPNGKPMFFGSARIRKDKVSFYLMPVYTAPALLADISPELKKRMQGKSCFNFNKVDPALFKELGALAKVGLAQFKKDGWA